MLTLATQVHAQDASAATVPTAAKPNLTEICAKRACRSGGFNLALFVDETHLMDIPVNASPYITNDDAILIFPGETFAVTYTVDGRALSAPRFYQSYAPELPASIDHARDGSESGALVDNPDNAKLPPLPQKDGNTDYSALPPNTVVVSYGQPDHSGAMHLMIWNNLHGVLKIDADMMVVTPGKAGYKEAPTSTCPVMPQTGDFEMWPEPLGPIFLSNAHLLADGEDMACR